LSGILSDGNEELKIKNLPAGRQVKNEKVWRFKTPGSLLF